MRGTVRSSTCRGLLLYCESVGVDSAAILRGAGVATSPIEDPDSLLTLEQCVSIWRSAYVLTGDENLALHTGEWAPSGPRSVLYYLCVNAPTVGAAFSKLADYGNSLDNTTKISIGQDGSCMSMSAARHDGLCAFRPQWEFMLALSYCGIRHATGTSFRPASVEFSFVAPRDTSEHERVFGCPVRFGRETNRIWLHAADWEQPSRHANNDLLGILENHARVLAAELPRLDSVCDAVLRVVAPRLDCGSPTIEQVASAMSLSARTLQRRLAQEGVTFSDLVDGAREETSLRLICEPGMSLAEISQLVGFSEQSAFTRAFKKWTGTTPADFRRHPPDYSTT